MSIFTTVAQALQSLFGQEADDLAKEAGFIKRQRKMTGSRFLKTLLFGWMQKDSPSVEGLARAGITHDLEISAQGLEQRFTPEACLFVKSVVEQAIKKHITAPEPVEIEILNRFSAVYVADTSVITLPDEMKTYYEGSGGRGNSSKSALKLDVCLELKTGGLEVDLLNGKDSDNRTPIAKKNVMQTHYI